MINGVRLRAAVVCDPVGHGADRSWVSKLVNLREAPRAEAADNDSAVSFATAIN